MKIKFVRKLCILFAAILIILPLNGCGNNKDQRIHLEDGKDYRIEDDINKVTITGGLSDQSICDACITIAERENDLTIVLDNVNFKAKDNRPAIYCENRSYTLTVRFMGQSIIIGGSGSKGSQGTSGVLSCPLNWNGGDGLPGQCALRCGDVIFEAENPESRLTLKGGRGGDGGDAGSCDFPNELYIAIDKPNGGAGGPGAAALSCRRYTLKSDNVNFEPGYGGWGGNAGYSHLDWFFSLFDENGGKMYGRDGKRGQDAKAVIGSQSGA